MMEQSHAGASLLSKTLDSIQVDLSNVADLSNMAGRANAWAEGDIETLRTLPHFNQCTACSAAFTNTQIMRKYGMKELEQQLENEWMRVVENALANSTSTFAISAARRRPRRIRRCGVI